MVLSVPLRVGLVIGIVLIALGLFALPVPANLWARLLGCLIVLGVIITGFVQRAAAKRRNSGPDAL